MVAIEALDHLVLNIRDVELIVSWYTRVLGMTRRENPQPGGCPARVSLHFGEQKINVRPVDANSEERFTGAHPATGSGDLCFLTAIEPAGVIAHLEACAVPIEVGPVERDGARGRLRSIYCRDPDGNLIEIASYGDEGQLL